MVQSIESAVVKAIGKVMIRISASMSMGVEKVSRISIAVVLTRARATGHPRSSGRLSADSR
jgi:hypothetical protein